MTLVSVAAAAVVVALTAVAVCSSNVGARTIAAFFFGEQEEPKRFKIVIRIR